MWMKDGILTLAPQNVPRLSEVRMDGVVLLFTFGVSVLTGVLFGVLPAWHASRGDLNTTLKEGGRTSGGSSREGMRKVLLVGEVGLSLVLLIALVDARTVFECAYNPLHSEEAVDFAAVLPAKLLLAPSPCSIRSH